MICIIAGNYKEAETWAAGQNLDMSEWFYPEEARLKYQSNFHVIVVGTAGENVPVSYFNRIYTLAKSRGRVDRV